MTASRLHRLPRIVNRKKKTAANCPSEGTVPRDVEDADSVRRASLATLSPVGEIMI